MMELHEINNMVCEIIGEDHPVALKLKNGEFTEIFEVLHAVFTVFMAETASLNDRMEKLEDQNGS